MQRPSTIYDVARSAKVAPSTVSRAFSRPELLKPSTVSSVLKVAQQLDYHANRTARSLSTGRTGNIAILVPNIANPFFTDLMRAFHQTAQQRGYSVFIVDTDEAAELDAILLAQLSAQVDGVALVSPRVPQSDLELLVARGGPYVTVNRQVRGVSSVTIDSSDALAAAVDDLRALGHRRIVYVRGPVGGHSDLVRRRQLKILCRHKRMELDITPARSDDASAAAVALEMVSQGAASAVMAHSDFAAIALLAECRHRSIPVPDQLSVVAHDGVRFGTLVVPALSTIDARPTLTGLTTAARLIDLIEGKTATSQPATATIVAAEYVKRDSTSTRSLAPLR